MGCAHKKNIVGVRPRVRQRYCKVEAHQHCIQEHCTRVIRSSSFPVQFSREKHSTQECSPSSSVQHALCTVCQAVFSSRRRTSRGQNLDQSSASQGVAPSKAKNTHTQTHIGIVARLQTLLARACSRRWLRLVHNDRLCSGKLFATLWRAGGV